MAHRTPSPRDPIASAGGTEPPVGDEGTSSQPANEAKPRMSASPEYLPPHVPLRAERGRLPIPRPLSRRLVRAAGERSQGETMSVGTLIGTLGDRSFGWCIVLFAVINLIPMPFGGMVFSIPLILVACQMALGLRELRLPPGIMRRDVSRKRFQKVVMRLRPIMRPIERMVRPRHLWLFSPRNERLIGVALLAVAIALFLPIPLSGWLPSIALLVVGIGLVERDGAVAIAGLSLGALSVVVTAAVSLAFVLGVQLLAA